ncbi:hypothetical protein JIN84_13590 [Luteolibacter yonseiensis]|uniref:Uncharacterized protein n=1 Tax=Luteolibacter yonseiensis TaxID=1144680 RepID=A0A934VAX3_9BACT|nr:hypothetical protein [Luteolibacter yonseiensis]MBK1816653.1 hypothetical protein [Luteolibacter yonseiensis]
MEAIDRDFRPPFWRIAGPLMFFFALLVVASALAGTTWPDHPWLAAVTDLAVVAHAAVSAVLLSACFFTRLALHSSGPALDVTILFAGLVVLKRSVAGRSWHPVATPGGSPPDVEGSGTYRIEVATNTGKRVLVLGPFLCWLFKIECL